MRPVISKDSSLYKECIPLAASAANRVFIGDPVVRNADGEVVLVTGAGLITGVVVGLEDAVKMPQSYYPGGDLPGWKVLVASDPQTEFVVPAPGGAVALADVGANCALAAGPGNEATGLSGYALAGAAAAGNNQVRILRLHDSPDNMANYELADPAIPVFWVVRINQHTEVPGAGI